MKHLFSLTLLNCDLKVQKLPLFYKKYSIHFKAGILSNLISKLDKEEFDPIQSPIDLPSRLAGTLNFIFDSAGGLLSLLERKNFP